MGVDIHVDQTGMLRRLGTLTPPKGFVSAFPVFEDSVQTLSDADLLEIARSGIADGRKRFDSSFIKNQRSHGSCNGFAGAGALTRARVRRGLKRVDLSGAYLYSLINGGSDNGSALEDGMKVMQSKGIASEALVGWDAIYPNRQNKPAADAEALRYQGFECYATRTLPGTFTAVALGFDIVVAVHVGSHFEDVDTEGVPGRANGPGNHAVGADGLTCVHGNQLALTNFNSWDVVYGQQGRMCLTQDHLAQPISNHTFYAIRSTEDDPNAVNPPVAA